MWKFFKDSNVNSFFAGFYILESFLGFAPDHFKDNTNDLYSLFQSGLSHENCKLKLSALRCFSSYLDVLEIKKQSTFQPLITSVFAAVYALIQNEGNEEGLEALSEMLETEPRFFKKNFKDLTKLLTEIFKMPDIEPGVKRMATEILVDYSEKSPALFRKNKDSLQETIEMVFTHMVDISNEITDEWKSPPPGYNEDM